MVDSPTTPILQVKDINQYYGGSHILRGVSLEARLGKVTVLLGWECLNFCV